jgi:hypothetical protein
MRQQSTGSIIAGAAFAIGAILGLAATGSAQADSPVLHAPPFGYAWQLSADDEARLYARVETLRYGDSLMRVKALLGEPTREDDFANKRGDKRHHALVYAIRRVEPQGGNTYDQEIQLIFGDESHRLLEICYSNMPPLSGDIIQTMSIPGAITFTKPPMQ